MFGSKEGLTYICAGQIHPTVETRWFSLTVFIKKIKQEIKTLQNKLETLKKECGHKNTFRGNFSYRPGVVQEAIICKDCEKIIKVLDV